ncbi:MAG: P-loop NTPase [Thermoguttaceae bacterium]|jgi:Mrp family chromosome partitioning ATPase|nr:P-loop NTPase [Thermoguttaceae bacterium]
MSTEQAVSLEAMERFDKPRNYGPLESWDGHARITGPCGDTMEFWIQIEDCRIARASFITDGCGPSRAAGSMATELATGELAKDALQIEQKDVLQALQGLPKDWEHCALLAVNTLKAAIRNCQERKPTGQQCGECANAECASKQRQANESEQDFLDRQALTRRMCRIGRKLLIMSGKGGVGKSTVAANLAVSLALAGKHVGLLDVDIHGPSIPKLMGLDEGRTVTHEGEIVPLEVGENLKVMSIAFFLPSNRDAVIWRGPMKYGVIRQFLKDVAWGMLDYLVVDAPPGTGDEPLSVAQMFGQPAGAVLVTTPQDLAIADVRRSVSFCEKVSLPVVGIIENMSGLACPHCGGHIDLFKTGGGESLAQEMGVPLLGRIPIDPQIVACGDDGVPYVHRFAESPAAQAFAKVVEQITKSAPAIPIA